MSNFHLSLSLLILFLCHQRSRAQNCDALTFSECNSDNNLVWENDQVGVALHKYYFIKTDA